MSTNSSFIKIWQELRILYTQTYVYLYFAQLFLTQEMFQKKKFVKDFILYFSGGHNFVFSKIVPFIRECGKIWYSQTGHRWQYNATHALCMQDKYGYRHTLRICNNYCLATSKANTPQCYVYTHIACLVPICPDEDLSYSDKCVLYECLIQKHAYIHFTISQWHIIYWFIFSKISATCLTYCNECWIRTSVSPSLEVRFLY
jgi:hypothetical protein